MQLEDLSKDELIGMIAKQDEFLREERHINVLLLTQVEQMRKEASDTVAIPLVEFKDAQPVQQPAPAWYYKQEFLNWNRSQDKPPVAIPKEMGVAEKAVEFYLAEQALAAPVAAPVTGKIPTLLAYAATDLDGRVDVGMTPEKAKERAGHGCDTVFGLYDLGDDVPVASVQPAPEFIQKAFVTLETCEGKYQIVMKFNQKEDAYATHDFLIQSGGREYNTRPHPHSGRDAALDYYDYQQLFNAIAAATKSGGPVSISVKAFREYLAAHPANVAQVGELSDEIIENAIDAMGWDLDPDGVLHQARFARLIIAAMSAPAKTDKA